eukprot:g15725.t1
MQVHDRDSCRGRGSIGCNILRCGSFLRFVLRCGYFVLFVRCFLEDDRNVCPYLVYRCRTLLPSVELRVVSAGSIIVLVRKHKTQEQRQEKITGNRPQKFGGLHEYRHQHKFCNAKLDAWDAVKDDEDEMWKETNRIRRMHDYDKAAPGALSVLRKLRSDGIPISAQEAIERRRKLQKRVAQMRTDSEVVITRAVADQFSETSTSCYSKFYYRHGDQLGTREANLQTDSWRQGCDWQTFFLPLLDSEKHMGERLVDSNAVAVESVDDITFFQADMEIMYPLVSADASTESERNENEEPEPGNSDQTKMAEQGLVRISNHPVVVFTKAGADLEPFSKLYLQVWAHRCQFICVHFCHRPDEPTAAEVQRIRKLFSEHMKGPLEVLKRHSETLPEKVRFSWLDAELPKWAHLYLTSIPQHLMINAISAGVGLEKQRLFCHKFGVAIPSSDEDESGSNNEGKNGMEKENQVEDEQEDAFSDFRSTGGPGPQKSAPSSAAHIVAAAKSSSSSGGSCRATNQGEAAGGSVGEGADEREHAEAALTGAIITDPEDGQLRKDVNCRADEKELPRCCQTTSKKKEHEYPISIWGSAYWCRLQAYAAEKRAGKGMASGRR